MSDIYITRKVISMENGIDIETMMAFRKPMPIKTTRITSPIAISRLTENEPRESPISSGWEITSEIFIPDGRKFLISSSLSFISFPRGRVFISSSKYPAIRIASSPSW